MDGSKMWTSSSRQEGKVRNLRGDTVNVQLDGKSDVVGSLLLVDILSREVDVFTPSVC